tara:strand:- start:1535 stop:1672 length:138 start_codon:yes stop_codon:yes gene_type:complete
MTKIFSFIVIIALIGGFAWLGLKQPEIEKNTIEIALDTKQFLDIQ